MVAAPTACGDDEETNSANGADFSDAISTSDDVAPANDGDPPATLDRPVAVIGAADNAGTEMHVQPDGGDKAMEHALQLAAPAPAESSPTQIDPGNDSLAALDEVCHH